MTEPIKENKALEFAEKERDFFIERDRKFRKSLGFSSDRSEMSQRALDTLDLSSANRNPLDL